MRRKNPRTWLLIAAALCFAAAAWGTTLEAAENGETKAAKERGAPPVSPADSAPEILLRADPVLKETAQDFQLNIWIRPDLPKEERIELVWVKTVWGMTESNLYKNWEEKKAWGDAPNWYLAWTDIARFQGKLILGFQELNEPHAFGDSVQHIIVSEDDGANWKSVAHYEVESRDPRNTSGGGKGRRTAGFVCGYFCRPSENRLMMSGRAGHGRGFWHASAFSEDGATWTPLRKWKWEGFAPDEADERLETFRPAWGPDNKCYGGIRGGQAWRSKDAGGLVWENLNVVVPKNGRVAGNETAAAFVGDRLFLFLRSGQISSAKPPYTHWDINQRNKKGAHSYGGPNIKSLPDGEILTSSRGSIAGGVNQAVIFRYDGALLTPMAAAPSGATATGYPGFAWEDGCLWMSFMSNNDKGRTNEEMSRGLITVAKFKWPLKPGAKSIADVYDEREAAEKKSSTDGANGTMRRAGIPLTIPQEQQDSRHSRTSAES